MKSGRFGSHGSRFAKLTEPSDFGQGIEVDTKFPYAYQEGVSLLLAFFAALTAGRLVMIPPRLICAGSCGLSFERSAMMLSPGSCLRRFAHGVNWHFAPCEGASPLALSRSI